MLHYVEQANQVEYLKQLFTTQEAAHYLSLSKSYLDNDRGKNALIPFIRIGSRTVRYRREDLDKFISRGLRKSTADMGEDF